MFWRKKTEAGDGGTALVRAVREQLSEVDDETVMLVASLAGLLGQVAHEDRGYSTEEEVRIRAELSRVQGLDARGVDAVCKTLRDHIKAISGVEAREYARTLRDVASLELRLHVLDLLVDVAAADDELSVAEVNLIRRLTDVLGLTQEHYNASQARHREKIVSLRGSSGS